MSHDHPTQHLDTIAIHGGIEPEAITGAVMTPIFQTSTYVQSEPAVHKGFDYSRADNPTRQVLEKALACIEGAQFALSFASGLAAEQAIIQTLDPGCHILVSEDIYGGTGRLFRQLFAKYGFDFEFVDLSQHENLLKAIRPTTKLIWVESPSNPTLKLVDIRRSAALARQHGALVVVDNTFASPIFQQPLALGADLVVHSTTKYIGGHSDLIGGAVMVNNPELHAALKFVQFAAGAVPSPFECFLLLRSLKTLPVRMHKHATNAQAVAEFLSPHPRVEKVYFPGLPSHPQHSLAKEQMSGCSGMVSFALRGDYQEVKTLCSRLKLFTLAESLGGVESLINHPEKMTHASVPETLRRKIGIGPNLLRLSVGIEHPDDLIADLKQALA